MKKLFIITSLLVLISSCVSKKKFTELENNLKNTETKLSETEVERNEFKDKYQEIEDRVEVFNRKIEGLKDVNKSLAEKSAKKLNFSKTEGIPMSDGALAELRKQLSQVDPALLEGAKTLNDSINYFFKSNVNGKLGHFEGLDVQVDDAVVMINVSDDLLFSSGSFRVSRAGLPLLKKLAELIKSEPSVEVMVEGHSDSQAFKKEILEDNWDLSVKRATSIIRLLQWRYNVNPKQLIAAGRGQYAPIAENNTRKSRALNRRTRIVIMPNLDKFFSMIVSE